MPLLLLLFLLAPWQCHALNLGLAAGHYLESLEFYYQKPKPELLLPMLRTFSQAGNLARAEQRMFLAAFLATLARKKAIDLAKVMPDAASREQKLLLAWTMRLSGINTEKILADLPAPAGDQIRNAPARLEDWDPGWESSVLGMFWAAFMASGNVAWVDRIIDVAMRNPGDAMAEKAAASLYDYAAAHPLVRKRLRARLAGAAAPARERLEMMLARPSG